MVPIPVVQHSDHIARRSCILYFHHTHTTMVSSAPLSHEEIEVLCHARRVLCHHGLPIDAVLRVGAEEEDAGTVDMDLQEQLAQDGLEVDDLEAFREELRVEAETEKRELAEARLDGEEEEFWEDMRADWCARCVRHLAVDPMHVCEFDGRDDKCKIGRAHV